ncbi:MAG TPA: hypothetical protein VJ741_19370 [Solirubrobacteraceae bacterium]|nr:hypothetical protein [Solirubrobacteraceae bacterium]
MSIQHDIAELANAIHRIDEHLVTLHDRLTRIEETQAEWTTRGWEAPPGADRSSDEPA